MSIFIRAGRWIVFVLLQLLGVFAALEGIARVFDPMGISYYPEMARYLDSLVLEEPIGYRNRPGLQDRFFGVPVSINTLGLRDREVQDKMPGEFRILVMGDSVPFGIGVRYEDSFPHQLETLLHERQPKVRYRTLNMGVPSYNTEQESIQLHSLGLTLRPDAALLLFSNNDIEPKLWVLNKRQRWYVDLTQRSYAGSLLFVMWREASSRWAQDAVAGGTDTRDTSRVALDHYRPDSPRWQSIDRSLSEINTTLRARRIPFVLFTQEEPPFIMELLERVARREGFPLVTLRPRDRRWVEENRRLLRNSVVDGHPSPLGNRLLAELLAENLIRLKVLPGDR